jgi:hypothetical protein
VNRQSHGQQELKRYSHGRQFIADSFIKQLAIHRKYKLVNLYSG